MKKTAILAKLLILLYSTSSFAQTLTIHSGDTISETIEDLKHFTDGVSIDSGGTLKIQQSGGDTTYNEGISGDGDLIVDVTEVPITLSVVNITGGTTISSGTLTQTSLPRSPLNLSNSGAVYQLGGKNLSINSLAGVSGSTVSLGQNKLTINDTNPAGTSFNGNINGSGQAILNQGIVLGDGATIGAIMSGPGNVSISGGTATLTGQNTYTGDTTINAGSTLIGSAGTSTTPGSLQGTINNSGTLTFNQTRSTTPYLFSGNITGVGGVNVSGTSFKLTLSGNNTYEGPTVVSSIGELIGNVSPSSTLQLDDEDAGYVLGGANQTIGALEGFGIVNLGGNTLTVGGNNTSSTFEGFIQDGITSGSTGSGSLIVAGSGQFTFKGQINSTYTGGTTINAGSTLISATSTLPTPKTQVLNSGNILDNGTLIFNQNSNGTFAGSISGSGNVIIEGGSVNFTGTNSYAGGTTTQNGGSFTGDTNSIQGDIVDNGVVTFDQVAPGTYAGSISGTGSLIKQGIAPLTLKGVSLLTGQTTVKEGTLSVQGGLPSSHVVVEKIASLKGTGDIGSADIRGKIMPGHSIGVLQILNDFAMKPTAIYEAEVSVNGADTILVGGEAQLAGTLDLRSFKTKRPQLKNKSFTLLTAGTRRQGTFIHTSTDRIKYTVQYLPKSVQVLIGNMQDFTDAFPPGDNSNAEKTATYFDTFADNRTLSPDLRQVINGLDNFLQEGNSAAVQNAFNQIQPSQYKELGQLSFLQNELVNRTVGSQQQNLRESLWVDKELEAYAGSATISPQRVASFHHLAKSAKGFKSSNILQTQSQPRHRLGMLALPGSERIGMPANNWIKLGRSSVWVQSYGQIERTKGNHGNAGIRSETGGISLGGDHEVLKNTYLGFLGGMSTTPFHWQQGRGSGRVKSYYGGVYGTWLSQTGFYADGQIIAGGDNYNSHRNIVYPGVNRKARQSHNGGQFSTDLQAGYVWSLKHLTVQPYADATYMFVNEGGFREKGAQSLDFKIKGRMSQFFRGEIGAQVYKTYVLCDALIRPALQLSWVHKRSMGPNSAKVQGGLVSQAPSLVVSGDNRTRNQVAPGLALTVQFAKGLYIIGNVNSQFGGGQKLGDALLRVGYDF